MKRFFRNWNQGAKLKRARSRKSADAFRAVVSCRKRETFIEWKRALAAEKFSKTKGNEFRARRALSILKRRSAAFFALRVKVDRWILQSEQLRGVASVASVIWRIGLSKFRLVRLRRERLQENRQHLYLYRDHREPKWKGDIDLQAMHIAFAGMKGWLVDRRARARLNVIAVDCWRKRLQKKTLVAWRDVRAARIFMEVSNEVALDFWYQVRRCNTICLGLH